MGQISRQWVPIEAFLAITDEVLSSALLAEPEPTETVAGIFSAFRDSIAESHRWEVALHGTTVNPRLADAVVILREEKRTARGLG